VDWEAAHGVWTNHLSIGCEFGQRLSPDQYFQLRYEDLIQDDVGYARQIFDFLGIELDPAVIRFCEHEQRERTPFSGPTRNLSDGATISDWAALLSESEQLRSLDLLGKGLIEHGYETNESLAGIQYHLTTNFKGAQTRSLGPSPVA
jgi:hypothetical protein